jgi:hypothetical protein
VTGLVPPLAQDGPQADRGRSCGSVGQRGPLPGRAVRETCPDGPTRTANMSRAMRAVAGRNAVMPPARTMTRTATRPDGMNAVVTSRSLRVVSAG